MKKTIYVGCSLTHASEEFKQSIEKLKNDLRKNYTVFDFLGLTDGTEKDAYEYNIENVKKCDLFLAECSYPSTGLGIELGVGLSLDKQIIAVAVGDAKVSRLVQGVTHPKFTFRRYDNIDEIIGLVKEKIENNE